MFRTVQETREIKYELDTCAFPWVFFYNWTKKFCAVSLRKKFTLFLDVSLTVHLSITLANDQLDSQIFNTFITILYMYNIRALSCSSSGGQIVLIQHLVSSISVSDRPVHRKVTN
jgi:hypothetical protein